MLIINVYGKNQLNIENKYSKFKKYFEFVGGKRSAIKMCLYTLHIACECFEFNVRALFITSVHTRLWLKIITLIEAIKIIAYIMKY